MFSLTAYPLWLLSYIRGLINSITLPRAPRFVPAPATQEKLEYADLAIIDLSKAATPEGRGELVLQVKEVLATQGFFYAINHGYTQAQTDRIFDIANVTFAGVHSEEKKIYTGDTEAVGGYQGYKPRQTWKIGDGFDQIEHYNIHRNIAKCEHPQALRPFIPELEHFSRHNHFNILHPILRLLALGLELPEDSLVKKHEFDAAGESSVRFMKYYPRTDDEEARTSNVWLKGHTDFGSVTILWSQPVSGLQILSPEGKWIWVRHIDNALVINSGDALQFLSGGYYKPTIHRVVQPPIDQRNYERLGVFYFGQTDDDMKLVPLVDSPVLKRVGINRLCEDEVAPTMQQWRKGRSISYGKIELKMGKEKGVEEEIVSGVVVKHYN